MTGLVFAGVATWDTVAQLPHLPDPDGRVVAEAMSAAGGGPAATAAVTAARLGLPAALVAAVGADREAGLIIDGLRAEGVDTSEVRTVPGADSGACVVLVDRGRGSRAICVRPGPALTIEPTARQVTEARWLHVDHAGLPAVLPLLSALPSEDRPRVSYDAGNLTPRRCPPEVDVYVPTAGVLRDLYGPCPARCGAAGTRGPERARHPGRATTAWPTVCPHLLNAAHDDGARVVAATDGPRGAIASGPDGVFAVPAHTDIEVRSTLGAGDVFHGALVAALAREMPLPDALAYANAAAALSCRGLDGRSGIPTDDEVRTRAGVVPAAQVKGAP